jgi:two-component system sensor histidine kinase KdpD
MHIKEVIERLRKAQYITGILLVVMIAGSCFASADVIGYRTVALLLLVVVSSLAMIFDTRPVLTVAFLSALILNFFFLPPLYTFHIKNSEDILLFLMYFIVALVNIVLTRKIKIAEQKARDREEHERTIKLYNTMFNSLSHELKTPIASIMVAVDTLKESENLSQNTVNELFTEIETAGMRLNRQVEHLLNMSRLENDMLKPNLDWCDVNDLVFAVTRTFESVHSHTIRFEPPVGFPLIKIDTGLIENVLHNLVHNAVQYTPAGSVIDISVIIKDNVFILKVSDNGPGFPEEELPKVFTKFFRVANSRTGGTGLGLSIAKGFIEAHSGTIRLENQGSGGASFTVSLPVEISYVNNLKNE